MLVSKYNQIMFLKIFVDSNDEKLKSLYNEAAKKHNNKIKQIPDMIDAGFDLYAPLKDQNQDQTQTQTQDQEKIIFTNTNVNKLDFQIICSRPIWHL